MYEFLRTSVDRFHVGVKFRIEPSYFVPLTADQRGDWEACSSPEADVRRDNVTVALKKFCHFGREHGKVSEQ